MNAIDPVLKNKIDFVLKDEGFRSYAEESFGFIAKVFVDWEKERCVFVPISGPAHELSFWDMKPLLDKAGKILEQEGEL